MTDDERKGVTAQDIALALRLITSVDDVLDEIQTAQLERLAGVASALCESYAPEAPQAILDESAIRVAAYLFDVAPDAANAPQNAFSHSGAMSLLSFWRTQRATPIRGNREC